jgi:hypothetical protein
MSKMCSHSMRWINNKSINVKCTSTLTIFSPSKDLFHIINNKLKENIVTVSRYEYE